MYKKSITALLFGLVCFGVFAAHSIAQTDTVPSDQSNDTTSATEEHIQSFDSNIVVNSDSSINVTETITYDFASEEKHGIFRDITLTKAPGTLRALKLSNISVTDENGKEYMIDVSDSDGLEIKVGDARQTLTGVHTYVVKYTAQNAIGYFKDYDEIYWNATGNQWEVPIYSVTSSVVLPGIIPENDLQMASYCGMEGDTGTCGESTVTYDTEHTTVHFSSGVYIEASQSKSFGFGSGMTIAAGFPKGIVTPRPLTIWERPSTYFYAVLGLIGAYILYFLLWLLARYMPQAARVRRPIIAEYDAPEGLTPSQAALVIHPEASMATLATSDILYLATEGYITIEDMKVSEKDAKARTTGFIIQSIVLAFVLLIILFVLRLFGLLIVLFIVLVNYKKIKAAVEDALHPKDFALARTHKSITGREAHITTLYTMLTPSTGAVSVKKLADREDSTNSSTFAALAKEELYYEFQNYKSESQRSIPGPVSTGNVSLKYMIALSLVKLFFIGFFSGFVGMFIAILFHQLSIDLYLTPLVVERALMFIIPLLVVAVLLSSLRTVLKHRLKEKTDLWYKVMGLREYIRVAEKDRIKFLSSPDDSSRIFLKLLPYAVAFGMEDTWIAAFRDLTLPTPEWYHSDTHTSFSTGVLISSIGSMRSSMAVTSNAGAPRSSGSSSSGGSSGGGSSGGGGGGGGGGSW